MSICLDMVSAVLLVTKMFTADRYLFPRYRPSVHKRKTLTRQTRAWSIEVHCGKCFNISFHVTHGDRKRMLLHFVVVSEDSKTMVHSS